MVIIVLGTATVTASLVYVLMRGDSLAHRETVGSPAAVTTDSNEKSRLVDSLLRAHAIRKTTAADDSMVNRITELEAKLEGIETSRKERKDHPSAEEWVDSPTDGKVSEAELGQWMDENLGVLNTERMNQSKAEFERALDSLPGINLEDLDCGDQFCRATFARDDGVVPVISELAGIPSIVSEGFTITQPDGSLMFYFTPPGGKLNELRSEALAAVD
jgi:hypothetical protein